jgi:hypothetical protein
MPFKEKKIQQTYSKEYYNKNVDKYKLAQRKSHLKRKQILLSHLGMQCVLCGYNDPRGLVLDHINDDGAESRRRFKGTQPEWSYYSKHLGEAVLVFQVLCANCNMIKEFNRKLYKNL